MDRVMSARLSEEAIAELDRASRELRITKKQFLEEAIHLRAEADERAAEKPGEDIWTQTSGAWHRDEPPDETVRKVKQAAEDAWETRRKYLDSLRPE